MTRTSSRRHAVYRGGVYLAGRQALGTAIALAAVLLITKRIGPAQYGLYAAAIGVVSVLQMLTQLGVYIFLVRAERRPRSSDLHAASLLLLALGFAAVAVGAVSAPLLEHFSRLDGVGVLVIAMCLALPIAHLAQVPMAVLERDLNYGPAAKIEITGQLMFLAVGVAGAMLDYGAWAVVAAWWAQQFTQVALYHVAAHYVPRLRYEPSFFREACKYGAAYTASAAIHNVRRLVNPIVVGRFLGAEAVATISLASQIIVYLSFVGAAAWRMSTPVLAQLQTDTVRLVRVISESMVLQLITVGPFLLLFAWTAPVIVPQFLGEEWTNVSVIFPFIAFPYLIALILNLHSSALYVRGRNWQVAVYHVVHVALLAAAAVVLVPRFGLIGYGLAELVTVAGFAVLHLQLVRFVGSPSYVSLPVLGLATAAALFWQTLGVWTIAAYAFALVSARPWRQAREIAAAFRLRATSP